MKDNKVFSTKNMVNIAMFTAILSILSQISFMLPGGVPITLQTFGIVLIGGILGKKLGFISVLLYLLLGLIGLPVFSNFHGGFSVLVGPTGGYLIGFLPMVFFTGLGKCKSLIIGMFYSIIGLLICHILGLAGYYLVTGTWLLPSVPIMLLKDFIVTSLAIILSKEISKRLTFIFPITY